MCDRAGPDRGCSARKMVDEVNESGSSNSGEEGDEKKEKNVDEMMKEAFSEFQSTAHCTDERNASGKGKDKEGRPVFPREDYVRMWITCDKDLYTARLGGVLTKVENLLEGLEKRETRFVRVRAAKKKIDDMLEYAARIGRHTRSGVVGNTTQRNRIPDLETDQYYTDFDPEDDYDDDGLWDSEDGYDDEEGDDYQDDEDYPDDGSWYTTDEEEDDGYYDAPSTKSSRLHDKGSDEEDGDTNDKEWSLGSGDESVSKNSGLSNSYKSKVQSNSPANSKKG
ncbi:hypothetical protein AN958_08957 [Leucoagaricus sp. SymC.cos]|nr:hypothetical protein AN958_08957 [Leucoagaricus sp. SymC.cos]